jgi:hypothetical protein
MDMFAHTDAAYLIADSILGELTFVRKALDAAGCERVYASGDEAEALALIERERIDLVLVGVGCVPRWPGALARAASQA